MTDQLQAQNPSQNASTQDQLVQWLEGRLASLGYELVDLEVKRGSRPKLQIFIDRSPLDESELETNQTKAKAISIDDCVEVTRELDGPLDENPLVDRLMNGAYELEVSSPGVNRPLKRSKDFFRYQGETVRIYLYRPLSADESGHPEYQQAHPKQKSYLGILQSCESDDGELTKIRLQLVPEFAATGKSTSKRKKKKQSAQADTLPEITVPRELITKAHLEPSIEWRN